MWILVTVLGLALELVVIVALGRAATRGSEQDAPVPVADAAIPGSAAPTPVRPPAA